MNNNMNPRPYEGKEKYIFISYSHKDTDRVMPIISRLMNEGFRVWYDDGISPGTEWPEVIAQHLNDCELFVSFLSNSYMDSVNCKREIDFAVRKRKKFLAVFLEETELSLGVEMQISTVQSVNYYLTTPDIFFERFFDSEVVKNSGCREPKEPCLQTSKAELVTAPDGATSREDDSAKTPDVKAPDGAESLKTASAASSTAPGKKKPKILIPILLGVLVLFGITGAVIGIGLAKTKKNNTTNIYKHAIQLSGETVTDRILRKEAKRKDVRQIKLEDCVLSIKDSAVWADVLNENVTQITITGCHLTDKDAKAILDNSPGLRTLNFSGNELKELSFAGNPKLQSADLSGNMITHIEKTNLEELKILKLDDNRISDLSFLETAIHLQTFTASRNGLQNIDVLKNCALLNTVNLSENNLTDVSALGASKDCMKELNLSDNTISDIDVLWPMPELKKLSVNNNRLSELYLTESHQLSYLSAANNEIDTLSGDFAELTYIDVANNRLSGDYYFTNSPKLKNGFFENNNITELWFPEEKYSNGYFSMYNNPLVKLDFGTEKTSFYIYVSYNDELKTTFENKNAYHLYLVDCPYDLRVNYEKVWGSFSISFPDKNEVADLVEDHRKPF